LFETQEKKKIQKDDVDQETKAERAEKQEVCYQTPDLKDNRQRGGVC